jgi:hypothetical protein
VYDPVDVDGMARLMGVLSAESTDVTKMGEASRQIVAQFTPERWAENLADCIERTVAYKRENAEEKFSRWLSPGFWTQKQRGRIANS